MKLNDARTAGIAMAKTTTIHIRTRDWELSLPHILGRIV